MMAKCEAMAIKEGTINLNQWLLAKLPSRILEAIKSRRKNPENNRLVAEMSAMEMSNSEASPEDEATVELADSEIEKAIEEEIRSLEGNNLRNIRELTELARKLVNGDEGAVSLNQWMKSLFPNAKRSKRPCYNVEVIVETNGKRIRRQEYALLQKMYHKYFGSAVRRVLTDQGNFEMPPAPETIAF